MSSDVIPFWDFCTQIEPKLSPTPFHSAYYRVLEAFALGKIRRLIITMPPQHGKSQGASIFLPAYLLGLNPDLRVAIASYSSSLATKFSRRVQRIIESENYGAIFPQTIIKGARRGGEKVEGTSNYVRTAEEVDMVGREGYLLAVGREGSLTGSSVDCFILDDLYKNAMEANSPIVRDSCWEWYLSVVKTRMNNDSQELIVFTRWHHEDLIGRILDKEKVIKLTDYSQISSANSTDWFYLNFEAIKSSEQSEIDCRKFGEPLWPAKHGLTRLIEQQKADSYNFECLYQGNPSAKMGLLYGGNFAEYDTLPPDIVEYGNYTDTADLGDDYLCSMCYQVDRQGNIYITDVVYSREPMEVTEVEVATMLNESKTRVANIESNNGGRGFAREIQRLAPKKVVKWFVQSLNKESRIISWSATVLRLIHFPANWNQRWSQLYYHLTTYSRDFSANRWHDGPDVLTGIVEQVCGKEDNKPKYVNKKIFS